MATERLTGHPEAAVNRPETLDLMVDIASTLGPWQKPSALHQLQRILEECGSSRAVGPLLGEAFGDDAVGEITQAVIERFGQTKENPSPEPVSKSALRWARSEQQRLAESRVTSPVEVVQHWKNRRRKSGLPRGNGSHRVSQPRKAKRHNGQGRTSLTTAPESLA